SNRRVFIGVGMTGFGARLLLAQAVELRATGRWRDGHDALAVDDGHDGPGSAPSGGIERVVFLEHPALGIAGPFDIVVAGSVLMDVHDRVEKRVDLTVYSRGKRVVRRGADHAAQLGPCAEAVALGRRGGKGDFLPVVVLATAIDGAPRVAGSRSGID